MQQGTVLPQRDWFVAERDEERVRALARELGVTPVTAHLLVRRGVDEVAAAKSFLEPSLAELHDPQDLPQIDAATERLERAIAAQERILLFGDYDVDGTTGAVILHEVLSALGAAVEVHIPDRSEGYGVNVPRLERAAAEGVAVVVTIDNGIAAVDEAARCRELGLDLIVVDHHTMDEVLPEAVALVHPRLPGSTYPNPHLCGAGVAFKVAWAIAARLGGGRPTKQAREVLLRCLGPVALGTIADVVSLTGENRVLVRYGLRALALSTLPGVRALLEIGRIEGAPTSTEVAFRVAPRLNAAGRMGRAVRAFEVLTTQDPTRGRELALELDEENKRRRTLQDRVFREARAQVEEVYGLYPGGDARTPGIVVGGPDWPHGVVGIVAAKLAERYRRPTLVVSIEGDQAKGSGRSYGGVDLLAALEAGRDHLLRFGGHAAACGFSLTPDRLDDLRAAFAEGVLRTLGLGPEAADEAEVAARLAGYEVVADAEVALDEVSRQLLDELDRLAPFGEGNGEPLFCARQVTLAGEPQLMGKTGDHVSFHVRQGDAVFRTVAFRRPDLWDLLKERATRGPGAAPTFEVAFRPKLNRWNGQTKLELYLEAIRFPE